MQQNSLVLGAIVATTLATAVAMGLALTQLPEPETAPPVPTTQLTASPASSETPAVTPAPAPDGPILRSEPGTPPEQPTEVPEGSHTTTASGLKVFDITQGTGAVVAKGTKATLEYTGWLESGERFDTSYDFDRPVKVRIGMGKVTAGWDLGIVGMKVGGKRQLIMPPALAFGEKGRPPVIPPNATVIYDIEVVATSR